MDKHYMKTKILICIVMYIFTTMGTVVWGANFQSVVEAGDHVMDAEYEITETISTGGTSILDFRARVVESKPLELCRYTALDADGLELFTVLADGANQKVQYSVGGVLAEAPADEARAVLSRTASFTSLRPLFESGCDVYEAGDSVEDGRPVHVFNLYHFGGSTPRWMRVSVDPVTGLMLRQEIYDGEGLRTRMIRGAGINKGVTSNAVHAEFGGAAHPAMPLARLLSGEKPVAEPGVPGGRGKSTGASREDRDARLARVEATIERLPAVAETAGRPPRLLNMLAAAYCSRAYLSKSSADADQSITICRGLLDKADLSEFDRVESSLGLVRACLCRATLMPAEREKMERVADAILQKLTNDESLDPVLRNIAGSFSMQWQTLKDQGQPEAVVDWCGWMEQLRQWEADRAAE